MKIIVLAGMAAVAAMAAVPAFAQSMQEKTGVNAAVGKAPTTQDFVTAAAQGDMLEIESSKLAMTKADNARTRQFAERMVKDHTATSSELKALVAAGKVPVSPPSALDKAHQDKLDKLSRLSGSAFTKAYDELQLAAHKDAVSLFERYGRDGDNAELKAFASKTLPALQHHLTMAQDLSK